MNLREFLDTPIYIIAFGGILTLIGTCVTIYGTYRHNIKSSEKTSRIEAKTDSLRTKLDTAYSNLDQANEKLQNANDKIIELTTQLKNEVTGGDSKPLLKISHTSGYTSPKVHKPYYILEFDIENPNETALQSVKATVADQLGQFMLKAGVKHFRGELMYGNFPPTQEEINQYKPEHKFNDIGRIDKHGAYPLYTATFSPQITALNEVNYQVVLKWYTGSFTYYIKFIAENDKLTIKKVQLLYNGNMIDYHNYFIFK